MKVELPKELEQEFKEFLRSSGQTPPARLGERVLAAVSKELHPKSWIVFVKLIVISTFSGALTLIFCPQFGVGGSLGLMNIFMQFGPKVCSAACGALFLSAGMLASMFILRPEELRVLRRTRFLQVVVLSLFALSSLVCMSGTFIGAMEILWLLGALSGGVLTFETMYRLRFSQLSKNA